MRQIAILLCCFLFASLGGCAIPRTIGTYVLAYDCTPVMEGDTREKLSVYALVGCGGDPHILTDIRSHRSASEVLAFYREHLAARGWVETEDSKKQPLPSKGTAASSYQFDRIRAVSKEKIKMRIDVARPLPFEKTKGNGDVLVAFWIDGNYIWDIPSKVPARLIYKCCGEAMGLGGLFLTLPFFPL